MINTDRPDQSDGVNTVPKNSFQIENGVFIAKKTFLNNLMLRYGLTNSTEIRILLDAGKEFESRGLKPLTVSLKQRILSQKDFFPSITFVGYVSLEKIASKDFRGFNVPVELKLAFENELSDKFSISYNIGTSNQFNDLNVTFAVGFAPLKKVSTFVEYFATLSNQSKPEQNIDIGVLCAIKPELQFDFACGCSLISPKNSFFITFGISYLIFKKH